MACTELLAPVAMPTSQFTRRTRLPTFPTLGSGN